ncbi:MAG: alpha-amylase [archaeon]|nr:alpha-amylase [archaeon]MCP8305523.1 alpha-amylase [archaeon]
MFEVHQPIRLKDLKEALVESFSSERSVNLLNNIYDAELEEKIFKKVSKRCYLDATLLIKNLLTEHPSFKVVFSLSGLWLEQTEKFSPTLLDMLKELASTGRVEFLCQTYYHGLSSLNPNGLGEFREQILLHKKAMEEKLGYTPTAVENTELIYNNDIGRKFWDMGFKVAIAEGVERILKGRSPHHVYSTYGCDLRLLLRDYKMSDDIGFRFSNRMWDQYPLTADKYASWVDSADGDLVFIAVDYETFGEHHDRSTGILEFLKWLPVNLERRGVSFSTVTEAGKNLEPVGVFDVPPWDTISWADVEKDKSAWLGSEMQWRAFNTYSWLEPYIKALGKHHIEHWRRFGVSDLYHYMAMKHDASGEVHTYFNPFKTPVAAFGVYMKALSLLECAVIGEYLRGRDSNAWKVRCPRPLAFRVYDGEGNELTSIDGLKHLLDSLKDLPPEIVARHIERGDLQKWIKEVLLWGELAEEVDRTAGEDPEITAENLLKLLKSKRSNGEGVSKNIRREPKAIR